MHAIAPLLIYLSISLMLALVLGLITERLRLSPIVGYLLAGVLLGPFTPGVRANVDMAQQIAEVGVVLLMFGVGLHFNLRDLWAVRKVAIPGAIGQIFIATMLGLLACRAVGVSSTEGLIVGIAISVASTVVLVRVLVDNNALDTSQGHIAVGWLIVEDVFTVLALVILPSLAKVGGQAAGGQSVFVAILVALAKIAVLALLVLGGGQRIIPKVLGAVARTRSRELFTLSILAFALAVATAAAYFFDVSMALGAFLAGMVIGQTEVSHQAAADALPMRDAFAVLFFVSVGMLFDPHAIVEAPVLLVLLLGVVLLAKPFVALAIMWYLRYSWRASLTVAIALAQIGEFSFLLADSASHLQLMDAQRRSLLVACAMLTIALNPLWFRAIDPIDRWVRTRPKLWQLLSRRSETRGAELNVLVKHRLGDPEDPAAERLKAVIVGYGPVGQTAARILRDFNIQPIVVDLNLDTVCDLIGENELAIYGDATRADILEAAAIGEAKYLMVTVPDVLIRTLVILAARRVEQRFARVRPARYLKERAWLEEVGATEICIEEAETAVGLALLLLREVGADEQRIREEIQTLHAEYGVQRPSAAR